jgi:hypothetical protein
MRSWQYSALGVVGSLVLTAAAGGQSSGTVTPAPAAHSAADAQWVEKTYRVAMSGTMTIEDAKRMAVNRALKQAVEETVGVEVSGSEFRQRGGDERTLEDRFISVVNAQASGEIMRYEMLDSGVVTDRDVPFYNVRVRAMVRPTASRTDPLFRASIWLNKTVFFARANRDSSDEIVVTVTPTKDAYITIFGVSDDTVQLLFPNDLDSDNLVKASQKREFPSPEWRRYLTLRAELPPGKKKVTELFYVVATREKVPFDGETFSSSGNVTTVRSTFQQLLAWLATIPPDQRTFAVEQFEIRAAR